LDETLRVYADDTLVATHRMQVVGSGWVTIPNHHAALWQTAVPVEQRPLTIYEEVAQWS
jgi:hypothetical protein